MPLHKVSDAVAQGLRLPLHKASDCRCTRSQIAVAQGLRLPLHKVSDCWTQSSFLEGASKVSALLRRSGRLCTAAQKWVEKVVLNRCFLAMEKAHM